MFRSEDMTLQEITCDEDHLWELVNKLGQLNMVEFIDLNRKTQLQEFDPDRHEEMY